MIWDWFDKFWHRTLGRPYNLARPVDVGGGETILLLHGLGRTAHVWEHVIAGLERYPLRLVAFDLLGFGASPKPKWSTYDVDTHAAAVIASLEKRRLPTPLIIVGHSMGCLVAVRVARLRPDLVKHLVLFEMPLYEGLPHKRIYRLRTDLWFRFYRRVIAMQPSFSPENARLVERLGRRIVGLEVTPETWQPFIRSLANIIMKQTAADDIKHLKMPMDVIYGRFDMLVIRGQPQHIFGVDTGRIAAHTIRARHEISPRTSLFITERVLAALQGTSDEQ